MPATVPPDAAKAGKQGMLAMTVRKQNAVRLIDESAPVEHTADDWSWAPAILHQADVAIAYLDGAGVYRYANPAYRRRRCGSQDPVGRTARDSLGPAVYERIRNPLERALGGERVIFRADLRDTPLGEVSQIHYIPEVTPDGKVRGIGIMIADVHTPEREADETRDLLEAAPDAIVIVDPRGRIDRVNQMAEHLFGYRRDEMLGQSIEMLLPPGARAAHANLRNNYNANVEARRPMGVSRDVFGMRDDGTQFPAEVTLSPIHRADGCYVAADIRDVTARKAAEAAMIRLNAELEQRVLERTSELARHVAELESFSYSVSHDLRAPLRHIEGYVDIIARGDVTPERFAHCAQRIQCATRKMNGLIDGMLTLARLNKAPLNVETVDLAAMVNDIRDELESRDGAPSVNWNVAPLPTVRADPVLLRTALVNLLDNAIKYSRKREQPEVSVSLMSSAGPVEVVVVQDNGDGFDMKYAHKLFTPFQRLHHEHEFEGVGIGLATVRRVIERHGGRIWAEAKKGAGASFFFTVRNADYQSAA